MPITCACADTPKPSYPSSSCTSTAPRIGIAIVSRRFTRPDGDEQRTERLRLPFAQLPCEPGAEHVVVQIRPAEKQPDEHRLHAEHPVEVMRRPVEGMRPLRKDDAGHRCDAERAPADRPPPSPELAQQGGAFGPL
jgi:hypothetical protein